MELVIVVVVVAGLAVLVVFGRRSTVTVYEHQRGLRYDRGRLVGTVEPGHYRFWTSRTSIRMLDVRVRHIVVPGQEILTTDGVTVRVSLAASYEFADVTRAVNAAQSYEEALYTELQVGLRKLVGGATVDELLQERNDYGTRLLAECAPAAEALGLRLAQVDLRDLMFPGDLKRVFAQVVAAQKEGQASLERARGESAALRNLANAAQTVKDNPALLQLRLLQQLGNTTGNTIVLSLGDPGAVPPAQS